MPPRSWIVAAAAAVLVGTWVAAALIRVLGLPPWTIDTGWDRLITATTTPPLTAVASALAIIGTGLPAAALALVAALWIVAARGWRWGLLVVVASALSELDVLGLKALAMRARPDAAFGVANSFPSGHTANAALLAVLVGLIVPRLVVRIPAVLYAVAMAWSRTALHAHWMTDVVAGALVGAATAVLVHAAVSARIARRTRSRATPTSAGGVHLMTGSIR